MLTYLFRCRIQNRLKGDPIPIVIPCNPNNHNSSHTTRNYCCAPHANWERTIRHIYSRHNFTPISFTANWLALTQLKYPTTNSIFAWWQDALDYSIHTTILVSRHFFFSLRHYYTLYWFLFLPTGKHRLPTPNPCWRGHHRRPKRTSRVMSQNNYARDNVRHLLLSSFLLICYIHTQFFKSALHVQLRSHLTPRINPKHVVGLYFSFPSSW